LRTLLTGLCLSLVLAGGAMAQQPASSMLTKLHGDLHLTPDQEGAWGQYIAAMNDGGQMQARRESAEQMLPQLPTPRRLALMDATMTQELADFRRQTGAIGAFYGRLTPDQQRTFDRETAPPAAQQGAPPPSR
jgi:LTXXQ motif family protein